MFAAPPDEHRIEALAPGAFVVRGFAAGDAESLVRLVELVAAESPFRRVATPYGKPMSVEMTNCGDRGWVSDRGGYRYEELDPVTGRPWPAMPEEFLDLADRAALLAGYGSLRPDVCLVNRYAAGSSMGMHQDRDERDFTRPIVSVSLGLPIRFRIGGATRGGRTSGTTLEHGDVVVFGGPSRLAFHGVGTLRPGRHPVTGEVRYNLTFRVSR